jgi:hypothetical protein
MGKSDLNRIVVPLFMFVLVFLFSSSALPQHISAGGGTIYADASQGSKSKETGDVEKKITSSRLFVYKPPIRGKPGNRIGGGTRGLDKDLPVIAALVPDHTGLTTISQPTLYWYLSKPSVYSIEFTLNDEQGIEPLVEVVLKDTGSGIQSIRLSDFNMALREGIEYQWFVAVVRDQEQRSKDIIAVGTIKRIEASKALNDELTRAGRAEAHYIYAEHGIWYDALSVVSELIKSSPDDQSFVEQRKALLQQAGLSEIVSAAR